MTKPDLTTEAGILEWVFQCPVEVIAPYVTPSARETARELAAAMRLKTAFEAWDAESADGLHSWEDYMQQLEDALHAALAEPTEEGK